MPLLPSFGPYHARLERIARGRWALAAIVGALAGGAIASPAAAQNVLVRTAPLAVDSEPFVIKRDPGRLRGTFVRPVGVKRPPLVVFIGDDNTDRDGNLAGVGARHDAVRQLAESLAVRGVASLRYDRRGVAGSATAAVPPRENRFDIPAWDAASVLGELRMADKWRAIVLVGVGEGGVHALVSRKTLPADGYVLIGAPGRTAEQVLRAQLPPARELWPPFKKLFSALRDGEAPPPLPFAVMTRFPLDSYNYLGTWLQQDPRQLIASTPQPCLLLHGTTDREMPSADADSLADAQPGCLRQSIDGMAHSLKQADDTDASQRAAWSEITRPLAPGLVDAVYDFVQMLIEPPPPTCTPAGARGAAPRDSGVVGAPPRASTPHQESPALLDGRYIGRLGTATIDQATTDSIGQISVTPPASARRYGAAAGKCGAVVLRTFAHLAADTAQMIAAVWYAVSTADTVHQVVLDLRDTTNAAPVRSPRVHVALRQLGVPLAETARRAPNEARMTISAIRPDTDAISAMGVLRFVVERTWGDVATPSSPGAAATSAAATSAAATSAVIGERRQYRVQRDLGRWSALACEPMDSVGAPCVLPASRPPLP